MPVETMTKLPSDSFWPINLPEGHGRISFPKLTSDSSTSIISPLTLPRGITGYFDQVVSNSNTSTPALHVAHPSSGSAAALKTRKAHVYSPLSPGVRGPALYPNSFLSPHLLPTMTQDQSRLDQHRSSSLPPQATNGMASPSAATNGSSHPRSVSADAVATSPQDQMAQRYAEQNKRLREAWEAERKHLQANRERAEEVYKEERALMEEERAEWDAERAFLMQRIEQLEQALAGMGSSLAAGNIQPFSNAPVANGDHRNGSQGSSRISPGSSLSSQGSSQPGVERNGPARRNGNLPSPMAGPRTSNLASPRSPNGPSAATTDFLKPAEASAADGHPVPVIDVQEIYPELEGIRVKATSVKSSFTAAKSSNGAETSSTTGSPPASSDQSSPSRVNKEQTLQVLAAKETDRLTMHAGHTPNHSLSCLATEACSGAATLTSNGGDSTPRMLHEDAVSTQGSPAAGLVNGVSDSQSTEAQPVSDSEPMYEPAEDRGLKAPLMVRNMPRHDKIFFETLNNKLEEVCKDTEAALPSVLKNSELVDNTENPPEQPETHEEEAIGSDPGSAGSNSTLKSDMEEFQDIPLKFKSSSNFGAPFGELRYPRFGKQATAKQ